MQALPLELKIAKTQLRIREWVDAFGEDGVYVSFSGGKDSTVLLDIARKMYPNIKACFVNTGLEYPSVRKFALSKENVTEVRPTMNFKEVVYKYGYPVISKEVAQTLWEARKSVREGKDIPTYRLAKLNGEARNKDGTLSQFNIPQYKYLLYAPFDISHKCCDVMKKKPSKDFEKKNGVAPFIGTMANESRLRQTKWLQYGCNAFETDRKTSQPMSFWTDNDVLAYIHKYGLDIAEAYGEVVIEGTERGQMVLADLLQDFRDCSFCTTKAKRTGCVFCGFGIVHDRDRFVLLEKEEPKLCDYVMRGGAFCNDGLWRPTNEGMGYWFVLEWLNAHGGYGIKIPNREKYLSKYQTGEIKKHLTAENTEEDTEEDTE
jgi:3'-phosphoadenosine 5'-phosphosulfate sulfotransferase (PAPS reductase)/FAD synthetase